MNLVSVLEVSIVFVPKKEFDLLNVKCSRPWPLCVVVMHSSKYKTINTRDLLSGMSSSCIIQHQAVR